ncbi:endo-1,4-beta-xylanase [Natronospora cellulosivora (SeqCode)]
MLNKLKVNKALFTSVLILMFILFALPLMASENLITNPGFETGELGDWFPYGDDCSVTVVSTEARSGDYSAYVTGRLEEYEGVAQELLDLVSSGKYYYVSAWVKVEGSQSVESIITVRRTDSVDTHFERVTESTVRPGQWQQLSGVYQVTGNNLSEVILYIEGPPPGVSFYVDDVSVVELEGAENWEAEANARIEELRKRDVQVRVVDQNNNPVPGAYVDVSQVSKSYPFGSALSIDSFHNPQYTDFFKENFNWAVFENAAKWYHTEPSRGNYNYRDSDMMYEWCEENDIKVRGHCVFWAVDQYVQHWVQNLSDQELRQEVDKRLEDIVPRYRGKFLHWDVNNEMLHGDFYARRLGEDIRTYMFQRTKELDPDAKLFINDYNVISYSSTDAYAAQIQDLLDQGAPIEGIGAQGHFGETVDPIEVKSRLDRLAEFGLPIWISEYDSTTPDEYQRADNLETLYRLAYSHPAVEGIMMWGFWASDHWRGQDAAIVNHDWSLNEAGRRYQQLMDEWETHESGYTNNAGSYNFRGFHGNYDITVNVPGQDTIVRNIDVEEGSGTVNLIINVDGGGVPGMIGDLNGDGVINSLDYTILGRYLLDEISEFPVANGEVLADINGDGVIDSRDLVLLGRYVVGMIDEF